MPPQSHPADERILEFFGDNPPEYVPIVANRLGIHVRYAERRVERLVDQGLLEPVSKEVIYTTTDAGERVIAGEASMSAAMETALDD
jgi:DNA-binding Lrp family transcriptional regulator